ncbi:MAG: LacI family transcriptional regulator [Verrucomicrobia bacterium]|nr:LacI family transcriptional regulator [Verrucomicrobiota bacterium]MBU1734491.1 LacI family transcriptional regulator [Verrucomicrobiota bacterium]MBU1856461.1 LacI family transcriptional regulator [Verrucomicrobiota bacterium]
MTTIYDIAREAGTSAMTVSRVLNGKSTSATARAKVERVVRKYGYVLNTRAANLKSNKSLAIGVIIADITNPVYPTAVRTMHDLLKTAGYHLILGITYGKAEEQIEVLHMMQRERVAGLLLGTCEEKEHPECDTLIGAMIRSGVPVVLTGRNRCGLNADQVTLDNVAGAWKAVDYLIRIGRKRIAFIAGQKEILAAQQRLAGYKKALQRHQIEPDEYLTSFGEWTRASGRVQMEKLLKSGVKCDAVFAGNDLLALGAMEALAAAGVEIPKDMAVVGFDDIELAGLVKPRLTTVAQSSEKITAAACQLLLDRISGQEKGEPKEILFEPELIVRETA